MKMNQENFIKSGILKVSTGSDVSRRKKTFVKNRKNRPAGPTTLKAAEKKDKKSTRDNQGIDVII